MKRITMWGWVIGGGITFIIGAILLPLPIPFGALLMVLGLFMMSNHPRVLKWIRAARGKFPGVSARLRKITPHMPGFLARFLAKTDRHGRLRKRFTLKRGDTKKDPIETPGE